MHDGNLMLHRLHETARDRHRLTDRVQEAPLLDGAFGAMPPSAAWPRMPLNEFSAGRPISPPTVPWARGLVDHDRGHQPGHSDSPETRIQQDGQNLGQATALRTQTVGDGRP